MLFLQRQTWTKRRWRGCPIYQDIKISWSDTWLFNLKSSELVDPPFQSFGPIEFRESLATQSGRVVKHQLKRDTFFTYITQKWSGKKIWFRAMFMCHFQNNFHPSLCLVQQLRNDYPLEVFGTTILESGLLRTRAFTFIFESGGIDYRDRNLATL